MKKELVVLIAAAMGLTACGGGGSSSTAQNTNSDGEVLSSVSTGYALPTEISAVPASNSSAASFLTSRLHALARAVAVANLPANSDYQKTGTRKFVEERSLKQFDIIEQVMDALQQTHYADQENINAGPYKAMIAWEDEQNGMDVKRLQPWVVESRMIVIGGKDVNRVLAWIEEPDEDTPGQMRLIKAEFKVYKAATQNADGSFADYGEWDLNVKFNDTGSDFFAATARIVNGQTVLKIQERQQREGQEFGAKAVMYRAGAQGYGKVQYPDMNCDNNGCTVDHKSVEYAYNTDYLALKQGNDPVMYKDRNGKTEFARRYGLFYADAASGIAAGDDVRKHKSFGFPVRYTDGNGVTQHAYYGAWQGRHQLWAGGSSLPSGTVVTREDRGPNEAAETYTVSAPFVGTLTKRTLVQGDLSDVLGIAVETFVNKHFDLRWDSTANSGNGAWMYCSGFMDFSSSPAVCKDLNNNPVAMSQFTDLSSLVVGANDRKNVNIYRWDNVQHQPKDYVYLAANPGNLSNYDGAGFYEATRNNNTGRMTPNSPAVKFTPADGDNIGVNIGGSIYIQYTNSGWVQKQLESFDQQSWTPKFVEGGDTPFTPEMGRDYYINNQGANFVVKRKGNTGTPEEDYEVWIELQTAANPVNYTSIIPADAAVSGAQVYLRTAWRPEVRYQLETAAGANFLKVVYANTDTQNPPTFNQGDVLTSGEWGLRAYSDHGTPGDFSDDYPLTAAGVAVTVNEFGIPADASQRPVEFNWEYSQQEGGWGTQQFLVDGNGNYKMLSDPIRLQPITVANGAGAQKTLSLQFDGWMHGLPNLYNELSKNNWVMNQTIADKVINIPTATLVKDENDVEYYVKPLEVSVFLNEVAAPSVGAPDINQAAAVSLDTGMPTYVEHNMGAMPANTVIKYSEGKAVQ